MQGQERERSKQLSHHREREASILVAMYKISRKDSSWPSLWPGGRALRMLIQRNDKKNWEESSTQNDMGCCFQKILKKKDNSYSL
jgi:hypothetical protein